MIAYLKSHSSYSLSWETVLICWNSEQGARSYKPDGFALCAGSALISHKQKVIFYDFQTVDLFVFLYSKIWKMLRALLEPVENLIHWLSSLSSTEYYCYSVFTELKRWTNLSFVTVTRRDFVFLSELKCQENYYFLAEIYFDFLSNLWALRWQARSAAKLLWYFLVVAKYFRLSCSRARTSRVVSQNWHSRSLYCPSLADAKFQRGIEEPCADFRYSSWLPLS